MTPHEVLEKYWNYKKFRPFQEEIIQSILTGNDTLALLPTGGGKSICYQVPALVKPGMCLVISPLIALMKDQVENLRKRNIPAAAVYTGMSKGEIELILNNCNAGAYKFLYLSPERLNTEDIQQKVMQLNINLLAVDEAHCISQWGFDFRPEYLNIAEIRPFLKSIPILATTATATVKVVEEIRTKLQFRNAKFFKASFFRFNLQYVVVRTEDKWNKLLEICNKVQGTGIVYVRNRKESQDVSAFLRAHGHVSDYYHAGIEPQLRAKKQDDWINNRTRIIVCTNAFGMGIDKPDVRFVVHLEMPDSLESYYQEAGRAGRDAKRSFAVVLHAAADVFGLKRKLNEKYPELTDVRRVYELLGSYFNIAVGSGLESSFDFDISDFCKKTNLQPVLVHSSIKVLERCGLIKASEGYYSPSKLHFIADREELYKFQIVQPKYDEMIKVILRSYGGIFDSYTPISEREIARRLTNVSEDAIKKMLLFMQQIQLADYQPARNKPQIVYTEQRYPAANINLDRQEYDKRKENDEQRMQAAVEYANNTTQCRSRLLLHYFDEPNSEDCGKCDVCLTQKNLPLQAEEFNTIKQRIKEILQIENLSTVEMAIKLNNFPKHKVEIMLDWLLDNGQLKYNNHGKLIYIEE